LSEAIPQVRSPGAPKALARAALIAVACMLGLSFWWTALWMVARWRQPGGYYGHGWLVLLVGAVLIFLKRKRILACTPSPSGWGMVLLVPSLLLHLVATSWHVGFLSGFALLGVLSGLVLGLLGKEVLRLTLFPIVFLAFMVPVPAVLIEKVSFGLKLLAARASVGLLGAFGLAAVRVGSYIHIPTGTIIVDDVCSGLKYLIALTAFGALYAYVSPLKGWRKALLFLFSVPVAFVANVCRVTIMVVVAYAWGIAASEKWYSHDFLGFLLFVIAFVLLFLLEWLLLRGSRFRPRARTGTSQEDSGQANASAVRTVRESVPGVHSSRALPGAVFSVLFATTALSLYFSWPRQVAAPSDVLARIPITLGKWTGSDRTMDERVYEILGTRDVLSRVYANDAGQIVQLVIVLAQQTRKRTHPPEQCFAGEGYTMETSDEREVRAASGEAARKLAVRELILDRWDGKRLAWYFYKSGSHLSTSYWLHQAGLALRKMANPNAADILVRVDTNVPDSDIDRGRKLLEDFLSHAVTPIVERLP